MSPEENICPVCDTKLSKDVTKCPICGTDLSAIDKKALEEIDISVLKDKTKAIDDILALIEEEEKKVKEKIEKEAKLVPKQSEQKAVEEKAKEKKEELEKASRPTVEQKAEEKKSEVFSCPICNEQIPIEANSCPKCGAIFEEAVVFVCPVCQTEVPMDSNTCPKCGAIFESEEAPSQVSTEKSAKVEIKGEKVEKKPEEMARELALKVSEAKVLLETMRKFGVEEKEIKENISQALSAGKEKNYKKAIEITDAALAKGKKLVLERIMVLAAELEADVQGYSKVGCDVRKGIGLCERAIFAAETENFENAVKIYTQAMDFAKRLRDAFEARKKKIEELTAKIQEYASYGVSGMNGLRLLVEKGVNFYSKGETAEGDKCISEVMRKLDEALFSHVSGKIVELAAKLKEEKLLGMDVKDKIEYLKEANMCIKKKDYMQALMWVNKLERMEV